MSSTETATWFGPPERSLFGFVHTPADGHIRGGVALCPPVAYEYLCAHRTFRVLAERLAACGFLVLRFDYDGTGDSVGSSLDPGRVEAWSGSVGHALEFLRSAGAPALGLIGMRIGATLASAIGQECEAFVLWDPALSGKAFLREQQTLQTVALGGAAESSGRRSTVELVGAEYTAETVAALEGLQLSQPPQGAAALALLRADRPRQRLEKRLAGWSNVSVQEAFGQDRLLDRESSTALVPHQAIEVIVTWLDATMPSKSVSVDLHKFRDVARVSVQDHEFTERLVELGSFGLFGIIAEGDAAVGRPTLLCLNNAADHHIGPGRLWVEWGRTMAAKGWRVVRFDLGGLGDSPKRPGEPIDRAYPAYAVSDIAEVCGEFRSEGVVLLGLCSGGIHAMYAGLTIPVRGVIAVNSALHTPARLHSLMSSENPNPPGLIRNNHQRLRGRLDQLVPGPVWRALSAAGRGPEKPRILQALAARGVDIVMVFGSDEFNLWKARQSMRWVLDRLSRASKLTVHKVPGLDHAALNVGPRHQLGLILTEVVTERFGSPPQTSAVPQ